MTAERLAEILRGVGIDVKHWDIDGDWNPYADQFSVRLDYECFNDLLIMHKLVTAMLASGCTACRVEMKECGSGDEVSTWRELVMEFPNAKKKAEADAEDQS